MAEVFISYSTKDEEIANMVCNALESNGIKCWIAPRDISGGANWQPSITEAISESRVFIVIYSENSAQSPQVARELALADERSDHPRTIIPYKIDNTELVAGFKYYLVSSQWVTVDTANNDFKTESLISSVNKALGKEDAKVIINNVTINAHIHNSDRKEEQVFYTTQDTTEKAATDFVTSKEETDAFFDSIKTTTVETSSSVQGGSVKMPGGRPAENPAPVQPPVNNVPVQSAMSTSSAKPLPIKMIAIAGGILLAVILLIVLIVSLSGENNQAVSSATESTSSYSSQGGNTSVSDGVVYYPDIKPFENNKAKVLENSYEESFMVLGKEYNTGIVLNAYEESYVIFNCDGYDKVKFTVARVDNTAKGENVIRVLADEKELKAVKTEQFSAPQTVEYDISGKSRLRIAVLQSNSVRADIALTDICFYKDGEAIEENSSQESETADLVAVPSEKKPYENNKAEILDNSYEKSYLVLGKEYNTGIKLNAYEASYVIFDNSDGYETFYLTAAKTDNNEGKKENLIRVYADDKELEPIKLDGIPLPVTVEYNIKGARQIRIATEQSNTSRADILLYNMYFGKNGKKPEIKEEEVNAPDLVAVPSDKKPYEKNRVELLDNSFEKSYLILGKEHNTGIMLNANDGSYIIFDNSEGYETLYLTAAKTDNTSRGDNYIRVYADDKELERMSFGQFSSPVSMEYDIKGAKQIRIAVEQNHSSPAIMLLYDIYFAKNGKKPEIKEEEVAAPDLAAVPSEKTPYEHFKSEVFTNSLDKKYYVLGKEYNTGIMLDANEGGYIIFDNSEGYETLYLTISKIDDTAKGENRIVIYADGKELDSIELVQPSTPLVKEYDIKGVKQIRIAADVNHSSPAKILLYDTYFSKNGAKPQ